MAPFERVSVREAMLAWPPAGILREDDAIGDALGQDDLPDVVPVLDKSGKLLGAVRVCDIAR